MGEYADMAVDDALNGPCWGDYDDDDDGSGPWGFFYARRRRSRRKMRPWPSASKLTDFENLDQ